MLSLLELRSELMSFSEDGAISALNGKPLKLVDPFIYLGSNISSTKSDVNNHIGKAWTAIDRLSTIWKFDLFDEIKQKLFQVVAVSVLLDGCTTWAFTKRLEKNLMRTTQECYLLFWTNLGSSSQQRNSSETIQVRRVRYAGPCWRRKNQLISGIIIWTSIH